MAKKSRGAAYSAPAEENEIALTLDRRAMWLLGLAAAFGLAVGIGVWTARSGSTGTAAAPPPGSSGPGTDLERRGLERDLQLAAEAAERAAPEGAQIVDPGSYMQSQVVESDEADAGSGIPEQYQEYLDSGQGAEVPLGDIQNRQAASWDADTLATLGDPNVVDKDYQPFRIEDFEGQSLEGGPRLAISDLNGVYTYNFGLIPIDQPATHDFMMKNIGDADLIVSRIYSGCGCTAPRIGDIEIDSAGFLPQPLTLAPGEEIDFTVEFDPQLAKETGAQAKWLQIFSNDNTKAVFDEAEPELTHETRFRIVVQPSYGVSSSPPSDTDGG